MKLDSINKKILSELDLNARISISELARTLRISREVANYRLKLLEKGGIIDGYKLFVDHSALNLKMYRVYFKFYSIAKEDYQKLVKSLVEDTMVFWVGETEGFVDLVFGVLSKSALDFHQFYQKIIEQFRPVIKRDYVHEIITYSYLNRAYIFPKNNKQRQEMVIGKNTPKKYDSVDVKILKRLSENSRVSLIKIAGELKMESASIIYRIKQLEKKKIILGYKANINLNKINRQFYTLKMYLSNFNNKQSLLSYLKNMPFVVNFTESIGSWDVEVDIEVESDMEYHTFINDLKEKFPFISEILFFRAPRIFKVVNVF